MFVSGNAQDYDAMSIITLSETAFSFLNHFPQNYMMRPDISNKLQANYRRQ